MLRSTDRLSRHGYTRKQRAAKPGERQAVCQSPWRSFWSLVSSEPIEVAVELGEVELVDELYKIIVARCLLTEIHYPSANSNEAIP